MRLCSRVRGSKSRFLLGARPGRSARIVHSPQLEGRARPPTPRGRRARLRTAARTTCTTRRRAHAPHGGIGGGLLRGHCAGVGRSVRPPRIATGGTAASPPRATSCRSGRTSSPSASRTAPGERSERQPELPCGQHRRRNVTAGKRNHLEGHSGLLLCT
jgi:hypothetical protein